MWVHIVAEARHSDAAQQMLFADFGWHGITRATFAGAVRIAALHDKVRFYAMKCQSVVETLFGQSFEIFDSLGRGFRVKLDHYGAAVGINNRVVAGVADRYSIQLGLTCGSRRNQERDGQGEA